MQLANDTCLNTQNRRNNVSCDNTFSCHILILFIVIVLKKLCVILYFRKLPIVFETLQLYLCVVNKLSYIYLYHRITKIMLNKASLAIKYLLFVFNLIIFVSFFYTFDLKLL